MGRPGITKEDVICAYVNLLKQGRVPKPQNLRLELQRGSFSTIAKRYDELALRHVAYRPPTQRRHIQR
jgi:hypothetical protein